MPVFRPSCVAHFTLRFDESLQIQPDYASVSVDQLASKGGARSAGIPSESAKPLIVSQGKESFINNRVPLSASIELPGYRQAGNFSLTMDFGELPIDPRTVRAAAVELHLGSVEESAFAKGVTMPARVGTSKSSILDTRGSGLGSSSETLVLTAMIDKWGVKHTNDSSMITMSGRDLRGALLDTPITVNPKGESQILDQLKLDQPIDELVAQILSFHPLYQAAKFMVAIHPSEWGRDGIPKAGDPKIIPRHKKGAKGKKSQPHTNSSQTKMSFWDLIVQFCYFVGAIPLLKGTEILIRPVRRLYDQQNAGMDPTITSPFLNGVVREIDKESGKPITPLRVRRLVYGRDVEELEFERNYSGYQRPRVVRVISHNSSSDQRGIGKTEIAWWPPVEDRKPRKTKVTPGKEQPHEEILDIPVPGINDPERLLEIARAIYEEIGRGEIGGNASTKNLTSFGGDNADPDLLRLRPGDAVELGVDTRELRNASPLVSEYTDHMRAPFEQRVRQIKDILGDENLAQVIVATARGQVQQLQRFFRVSNVKYTWEAKSGVKVALDFQNYIEVRYKADEDKPAKGNLKRIVV